MSEKRDSNPRPRPWQGRALPTELFSQFSLLANPLASLSCPVFVVCVAKVGIIFELTNLLAKKIAFILNFSIFFPLLPPLQPIQARFHPTSPQTVTHHMPSSISTTDPPRSGSLHPPTPSPAGANLCLSACGASAQRVVSGEWGVDARKRGAPVGAPLGMGGPGGVAPGIMSGW